MNAKLTFNRVNVSCPVKQTSRLPSFVRVGGLETPHKVCRSRKRAEGSRKHFCLSVVPWFLSTGFCLWSYRKPA